jgi:hypothetical protein
MTSKQHSASDSLLSLVGGRVGRLPLAFVEGIHSGALRAGEDVDHVGFGDASGMLLRVGLYKWLRQWSCQNQSFCR